MPTTTIDVAPGRRIPAHHAPAVGVDGPRPGVVVLHDALGLGDDIREQCEWLAAAGFEVLAPDLYSDGPRITCMPRTLRASMDRTGPAFDDIDAARRWLLARDDSNGRVGVTGFCMGGGFCLALAAHPEDWDASAPNYGVVPADVDELLAQPCPIVASYGGRDPMIRDGARRILEAVAPSGVAHDVKEYPRAGHSFMNRLAVRSPLGPLLRVTGFGHHHEEAADARRRIVSFLRQHLAS